MQTILYRVGLVSCVLLIGAGCVASPVEQEVEIESQGKDVSSSMPTLDDSDALDDATDMVVVESPQDSQHDDDQSQDLTDTEAMSPTINPVADTQETQEVQDVATKSFDVAGSNFEFSHRVIHVQNGDTVTINFTSVSGFHDWVLDEFGATTERVNTGQSASVTFVADKVGSFEYYCSVGSHRALGMVGIVIVE